jgi:hypothetical protein
MHQYVSISTPPIQTTQITSTSNATTTSTTDVLMTGMTVTPIAGTYLVIFSAVVQQAGAGQSVTVSIYSNAVQDTASIRDFAPFDGGTLSALSASCCCATQGIYTVNGSQVIQIEWHVSGSAGTVFQRNMTLLKIG